MCIRKNCLFFTILCCLTSVVLVQAQIKNASFEGNKIKAEKQIVKRLKAWKVKSGNVELITNEVFPAAQGKQVLDLNGDQAGSIAQTIKGLKKNSNYTLKFEYADQKERKRDSNALLATADVLINGIKVAKLRNLSKAPNYIGGIGFPFKSSAKGTATIEFVSTIAGEQGLVIDNLRLEEGLPLAPPMNHHLVNGSFEMEVDSEEANPHIFGEQLPGWLIMRENIDLIAIDDYGTPDGKWVIDLGGHGPGGIAQTVTGLEAGAKYRLSLLYARHRWWEEEDPLTGEVFLDDKLVLRLSRNKWAKAPRWEKATYDFVAPSDGNITLSMYSTAYQVGGGILYDNIRIDKVSELSPAPKIPVLIVDGFSNHQWDKNTEYLKQILEASGKFEVQVSTCPNREESLSDWENWNPNFSLYPVVIQTCNNIFKEDKLQWPDQVKKSFEKYVNEGGGVYMYHGATNAFKNWAAYNQMIGLGWRNKDFGVAVSIAEDEKLNIIPKGAGENTGHGKRRDVLINRMGNHPIHTGMPKAWLAADIEVYRYGRGSVDKLEVISYAEDEKSGLNFPMEWVVNFGKGKVYSSTYGHLWKNQEWPPSMRCAAFQQTIIRAIQWLSGNEVDNYVERDFPTTEEIVLRPSIPDEFEQIKASPNWKLQFNDPCTANWQDNWFLDGQLAKIENTEKGMNFIAGPVNRNDAHHAVLWTKESFKGDVKIEYNYTRTDSQAINVNILFIQATGIGGETFAPDITQWNDYREVPTMSKYWRNMNLIHISYAAFPMVNEDPDNDYIRVRRYPATEKIPFNDTEVPPAFERTALFLPNVTYKMTWIKTNDQLLLKVEGDDKVRQYSWELTAFDPIIEGRIGLRHMFTRSAQYSDFNVYTRAAQ